MLDARDPLRYRSADLEAYAAELHPAKRSLLLLNKADLLPRRLRAAWAAYFGAQGLDHVFWSAKAAADALQGDGAPRWRWPMHVLLTLHQINRIQVRSPACRAQCRRACMDAPPLLGKPLCCDIAQFVRYRAD